mgnify:CR=1 FL=1
MKAHPDIHGFSGDFRWLSNFWPVEVEMDWEVYPSVEHAYQAAKTNDHALRTHFRSLTAGGVKRAAPSGKLLRPDWNLVRVQIMDDLLRQKFSKEPFVSKLLSTGCCYIEETNHWKDTFWGVCDGRGENILGKLIMVIRADLVDVMGEMHDPGGPP